MFRYIRTQGIYFPVLNLRTLRIHLSEKKKKQRAVWENTYHQHTICGSKLTICTEWLNFNSHLTTLGRMEEKNKRTNCKEMYPHVIRCEQMLPKTDKLRNNGLWSNYMDLTTK